MDQSILVNLLISFVSYRLLTEHHLVVHNHHRYLLAPSPNSTVDYFAQQCTLPNFALLLCWVIYCEDTIITIVLFTMLISGLKTLFLSLPQYGLHYALHICYTSIVFPFVTLLFFAFIPTFHSTS